MLPLRRPARERAAEEGVKFNVSMACQTCCAVSSATGAEPLTTRLTVAIDTFAILATSEIVERRCAVRGIGTDWIKSGILTSEVLKAFSESVF
jgi:hypothetical protein